MFPIDPEQYITASVCNDEMMMLMKSVSTCVDQTPVRFTSPMGACRHARLNIITINTLTWTFGAFFKQVRRTAPLGEPPLENRLRCIKFQPLDRRRTGNELPSK